jgi:hypothetical protein
MPPVARRRISLEEHLSRVGGEVTRAAVLLAAGRSMRFVPQLEERLADSPVQTGALFMQSGLHMAGLVSLCAVLEQARRPDLVNLPSLLRRLEDAAERRQLAARRGVDANILFERFAKIKERYRRRIEPMVEEVKEIRDNTVAHHGQGEVSPTTYGRISRLAERTIVLVEELHSLANDTRLNIRQTVQTVRWQSAAVWAKGIDGQWDDQSIVSIETDAL